MLGGAEFTDDYEDTLVDHFAPDAYDVSDFDVYPSHDFGSYDDDSDHTVTWSPSFMAVLNLTQCLGSTLRGVLTFLAPIVAHTLLVQMARASCRSPKQQRWLWPWCCC